MTVDLAKVLELHEEATRRRELKPCEITLGCMFAHEHSGDCATHAQGATFSDARGRLVIDQRDRYAAVVAMVPALVEEVEAYRAVRERVRAMISDHDRDVILAMLDGVP